MEVPFSQGRAGGSPCGSILVLPVGCNGCPARFLIMDMGLAAAFFAAWMAGTV